MSDIQTASDLMVERQMNRESSEPDCVLPHADVQKFLLELIDQSNFPGKIADFVFGVKNVIKSAKIKGM